MSSFLTALRQLIVDTYELNGQQPVVLIAHSMGNLYVQYLLARQDQSWKDKYIKSYISLAGPWGGAVKSIRLEISGDNLGVFVVNTLKARMEQRSMPSTAWLMPYDTFWNSSEILVYGPYRNYTVADYEQLFRDINFMDGYQMLKATEPLTSKLEPPGVTVHCLHGIDNKTPASLVYTNSTWYDYQPVVNYGNGDGTVNLRSLHGCLRWIGKQSASVHHQEYSGPTAEHLALLKNHDVMKYIATVLTT